MCINNTTLEELVLAIPTDDLWELLTYKEMETWTKIAVDYSII